MTEPTILVANDSGVIQYTDADGTSQRAVIHKGTTRVRAGHPLLKGNESLFKPLDVHFDVEDVTARPGAKRGTPRGAKKAAEPKTDDE